MISFNPDFWEITIAADGWQRYSAEDGLWHDAQLTALSRDEVKVQPLWEGAFIKFCTMPLAGDRFLSPLKTKNKDKKDRDRVRAFDLRTGKVKGVFDQRLSHFGDEYISPIVAGRRLVVFNSSTGRGYRVAPNLSATAWVTRCCCACRQPTAGPRRRCTCGPATWSGSATAQCSHTRWRR